MWGTLFVLLVTVLGSVRGQANDGEVLAGYTFSSNVTEHSRIDLDQKEMQEFLTRSGQIRWADAERIYGAGKNSKKSNSTRTLRGFSTEADIKMKGEGYFQLYKTYWHGQGDYADKFVTNALNGGGDFLGADNLFKLECAIKGSQYQNVWMYVIHELEDAINDCFKGNIRENDKHIKAWDEAWAFYAGSSVGPKGAGNGYLLYSLAEKRCTNFRTCGGPDNRAKANIKALKLFKEGSVKLNNRQCADVIPIKNNIVKQMTIPLMQGLLRYMVQTKKKVDSKKTRKEYAREHGEGWAFSAAILPLVDHCNASTAALLRRNFRPKADPPMKDSIKVVTRALEKIYGCLGFSCTDVGFLPELPRGCLTGRKFKAVPGTKAAACQKNKSCDSVSVSASGVSGGAFAGIIIGAVVGIVILGGLLFVYLRRKRMKSMPIVQVDDEAGFSYTRGHS